MKKFIIMLLLVPGTCLATAEPGGILPLGGFLDQVRGKHLGIKASMENMAGASERSVEGSLLFAPTAFATVQFSTDQSPASSTFSPSKTVANTYSLGVSQQFRFGLKGSLSYTTNYIGITYPTMTGPLAALMPSQQNYYNGKPTLELTQSLWRNGFGSEMRASEVAIEARAKATALGESYKIKATLLEAEMAYWRLSLAREAVSVQTEGLERARKIRDWNARRVSLSLADRADLIQAESLFKLRELDLRNAMDEERAASTAFNNSRGMDSHEVSEKIESISADMIKGLSIPAKDDLRDDVKAQKEATRAAVAASDAATEKNLPNLDLFGSVSLNGRDQALGTAMGDSFGTGHPVWSVGVRFSTPLALGTMKSSRAGYAMEKTGAEYQYDRKVFEQTRDWENLEKKFNEARKRFEIVTQIEDVQKKKLEYEKDRLKKGRSTTYQVLMFEQDFAGSQLSRIRQEAELIQIIAQMKTFGGGAT